MRQVTFNIPTDAGITTAKGLPIWFTIGRRRIRFMLQYNSDGKIKYLTHYASGMRLGSLNDMHNELICRYSSYHRFTKRDLAIELITKIVDTRGAEELLAKLDTVPVINH